LIRIAELDQRAVPKRLWSVTGTWESSGIIDASGFLGHGAWLLTVQAHSISGAAAARLQGLGRDAAMVEGGQLLMLKIDESAMTRGEP